MSISAIIDMAAADLRSVPKINGIGPRNTTPPPFMVVFGSFPERIMPAKTVRMPSKISVRPTVTSIPSFI